MNAYVVTAAASGCGKTLVTLTLCRALTDLGARVQPFKIGPDYIDARLYEGVARDNIAASFLHRHFLPGSAAIASFVAACAAKVSP